MPFWASLLIKMALQLGIPWLESHVSPAVSAMIETILKTIKGSPNQAGTVKALQDHIDKFPGFMEGADLVKE